jgi:putative ABC transport system permease protein
MRDLINEIRLAVRIIGKNPGFSAVAVLTLALGIGANTGIFSLYDQVVLQLLPVERPEELVLVDVEGNAPGWSSADNNHTVHSYPLYQDLKEQNEVFSGLVARTEADVAIAHGGESERVGGDLVSGDFFEVLGVKAYRGRLFTAEDDQLEGAHPVVVLSHGYWERRFGGRDDIIDQKVMLNGHPMQVIGVAPPGFKGVVSAAPRSLYVPLAMRQQMRPEMSARPDIPERMTRYLSIMARLKPGISPEQAQAALQPVFAGITEIELAEIGERGESFRDSYVKRQVEIVPALQGIHDLRDEMEAPLVAMMALVGLMLLIACINIAGLLLARANSRQREIAIRQALGAGRLALMRQLMMESLVLAFLGGVAGIVVAQWTLDLMMMLGPDDGLEVISRNLNGRLLAFNFLLALLTGLAFGLAPALQTSGNLTRALKDQTSGGGETRKHVVFRRIAVVAQVTVSVALLVAAGLFMRSLQNLRGLDPGFRTESMLTFAVDPLLNGYSKERAQQFYTDLQDELRLLPGVEDTAAAGVAVLTNSAWSGSIAVEGYTPEEGKGATSSRNKITPDYFRTMGTPVVLGREFTLRDIQGTSKVAMVNEAFVKKYFGGENPLGRKVAVGGGKSEEDLDTEIIGVVKNQKGRDLKSELKEFVYVPYTQADGVPDLTFYVRTGREELSLGPEVRRLVAGLDPNLPLFNMKSIELVVNESIGIDRAIAMLGGTMAGVATLLAAVGLYGLLAYSVIRRTREIGIRMALGAARVDVIGMVLREATGFLAIGLTLGLACAFALGRLLESQLFGLNASDPLVVAAAVIVLAVVALVAAGIPARRASRIEPTIALRYE